jgi:hypothetical protein
MEILYTCEECRKKKLSDLRLKLFLVLFGEENFMIEEGDFFMFHI